MQKFNIKTLLKKYFQKDEPIVLACSTWPDSMFLLYNILETDYKKNLVACYFNHKTRPETDDEEAFLEKLWKKHWFQVEVASCDFEKIKKLHPAKGFEELAREKRYAFFEAIMQIYKTDKMMTAHHMDDKLETFLFNLSRWTKLTGLINMTEYSGSIVRPLLNIEKKDILEYLEKNNLEYKIDKTNEETNYTRNYIRHKIIPKFERLNANYKKNITKTIDYFEEIKKYLDEEVINFLEKQEIKNSFNIEDFNLLSDFLQKEIIRYIYYISNWRSTIWLSSSNIKEIIKFINGKNNKTVKQIKNMSLKKDNKVILY